MTKASDNAFPSILITEGTEPSAPAAGKQRLYIDSTTHKLKRTDSSGTDVTIESAGGSVATDTIWDAAGDLAQGTGADTAAKLGAGTLGHFLMAGGAATALSWKPRELDYVQITSDVNITATSAATADTVITGSAVAYDGATIVVIEFFSPACEPTAGNHNLNIDLWDGSTDLGMITNIVGADGTNLARHSVHAVVRITPSNASHTYSIRAWVDSATGVVRGGSGGAATRFPAFIRITRAI